MLARRASKGPPKPAIEMALVAEPESESDISDGIASFFQQLHGVRHANLVKIGAQSYP